MKTLHDNIRILEKIEKDYGTLDKFVTSAGANTIVSMISEKDAKYKLFCVGEALAWEYLRNVGVDGAKPDLHLRRFLSSDRMGTGSSGCATEKEVIEQVEQLSAKTGKKKWLIDALIWEYCRDGYDSICSKDPSCPDCVLKSYCKKKV